VVTPVQVAPTLVDERPARERQLVRFIVFGLVVIIGIGGLTARMVYLQFVRGQVYQAKAEQNRTIAQSIPSTRGLIYDRKGRLLVTNEPAYAIKIRPSDLPFSQRAEVVARLSALLGIDQADINVSIDSNPGTRFDPVRIAQDVPMATANIIAEERLALPGVEVAVESKRRYVDGSLMSQLIGYTGAIDAETLKELKDSGYQSDDLIGRAGVEATYEATLRGTYGQETVERDATGRKIRVLTTDRIAQPGESINLTIDTKEQKLAEKAVTWAMRRAGLKRGVMIVMNPQTGEILAMVSMPTYDNNKFAEGISNKDFAKLLKNPEKPLLNHAINEQFPPGSTYKLVTGLGVLSDKKLGVNELVQTKPYIQVGPDRFWDWNHRGFGALGIRRGFAMSSDTFFYQMAQRLGIERLAYWARQLGFGAKSGIDLPGEVPGIVPDNEWKQNVFGQAIFPGEVLQAGIGQGYDTVTPLQILNAYAAVANGGKLYQPQVVREVVDADGTVVRPFKPKLIHKIKATAENLKIMRLGAREVVTSGHTFNLKDLPLVVAGKTGTAEFGVRDSKGLLPFHNWFVAFVPKHKNVARPDSELAVIGFAYDSNTVGNTATEMVKYYLQLHYNLHVDLRRTDLLRRGNFYGGN
jgi:penicillin-binding protein 2